MNQSYGRLVSRAAIAATAMASLLLLIKIFAWWYTGSVSILAALVDSLVDIGAYVYLRFGTIPVFDGYSTSDISNTDDRSRRRGYRDNCGANLYDYPCLVSAVGGAPDAKPGGAG